MGFRRIPRVDRRRCDGAPRRAGPPLDGLADGGDGLGREALPDRCLACAWPAPGAALAAFRRRLRRRPLPLESELVGAFDALENQRQAGKLFRRRRRLALAEFGHGGERHRPQGLDQDEPRAAFGSLAERPHPHLVGAVGLLLSEDQVADVLGVAADGRARARAALAPDESRDFVDGGAVRDGRVHGLPQLRRQPLDRGAPDRCGCRYLLGFILHDAMLARAAHALHRTMVRGIMRPATDQEVAMGSAGPQVRSTRPRARAERRVGKRAELAPAVEGYE